MPKDAKSSYNQASSADHDRSGEGQVRHPAENHTTAYGHVDAGNGHLAHPAHEQCNQAAPAQEHAKHDHSRHLSHAGMGHAGHSGHGGHMGNLKQKFFVSLLLAIPVIILSPMMGLRLPFQFTFPGSDWVVLVLSTVLYFYGGMPFLRGAKSELLHKSPAMMTLISLGITTAYVYSLYAFVRNNFLGGQGHVMDFFWELATLIVIMLLGHWIEMKAVAGAGDALQKMAELLPSRASVRKADGEFVEIPLPELTVGQVVMVKAGEKFPADGEIIEGETSANEALVTGEARDVPKKSGDRIIGGSQNGAGSVLVKVTGTGESGYLAQVMHLVGSAQAEKSAAETLSDKVARLLFYAAFGAGLITLIVWYAISGDAGTAVTRMVTVLVIACPHALGLAIPLVVARSTSLGARNGLLVRSRQAMETATKVDTVMMDKTGTLTEGNFKVAKVLSFDRTLGEDDVLSMMAGLEAGSSHPLAAGIVRESEARRLKAIKVSKVTNLPGVGLAGLLQDGSEVKIVNAAYLERNNIQYDVEKYTELSGKGYSVSFLLTKSGVSGLAAQGDAVKPQAKDLIAALKAHGITPVMLTGDNEAAAKIVASLLGLEQYRAGLLPEDKQAVIKEYQDQGRVVMMVGDGVNDAPSLARADIGVAIGAGTDVAIDSADVVLVKSDPADILHFLSLGKNTTRKMIQNLWWGAGYNIVAIPLAAGVLAPLGIILSPAMGAVLMSLSTIIVAANAMMLRMR